MGLTRRRDFLGGAAALLAAGCGVAAAPRSHGVSDALPERSGLPRVLVLMPDSAPANQVRRGLVDDLSGAMQVVTRLVGRRVRAAEVREQLHQVKPQYMVLMNNPTISAFSELRRARLQLPPAVGVLASFLGQASAAGPPFGVAYEIPAVVQVQNLRALVTSPVESVGVIHRAGLRQFVKQEAELLAREHTKLVALPLASEYDASDVARGLGRLRFDHAVDALWVINDDRLLTTDLLKEAWLPNLQRGKPIPVMVGVEALVDPQLGLGSFAMLPDHVGIGVQAANILLELDSQGLGSGAPRIERPVAVETVINLPQAQRYFGLRPNALYLADRVLT